MSEDKPKEDPTIEAKPAATTAAKKTSLPTATTVKKNRFSLAWLIPLLALLGVAFLLHRARSESGTKLTITFEDGHGLKTGDTIRHRGIIVGVVDGVELSDDLEGVRVAARLDPSAANLARQGSSFWVVRPQLALAGASGLETVVGAKYLRVDPGPPDAPRQVVFDGVDAPPLVAEQETGGLEIVVTTSDAAGVVAGAPVTYRRMPIGKVIGTSLSRDASRVEATLYIEPAYATLVRDNTRFWKMNAVNVRAGLLRGVEFNVESMQSLLLGGVAIATPSSPGSEVEPGTRFELADEPEDAWLDWSPRLPFSGGLVVSESAGRPEALRAKLRWQEKKLLGGIRQLERSGWVTPLGNRLLGPADLLGDPVPNAAAGATNVFELVIDETTITAELPPDEGGLLDIPLPASWAPRHVSNRVPEGPEAVLILSGSDAANRLLTADLLKPKGVTWHIDRSVSFTAGWHGAPVLGDRDKTLIGLLQVEGREAKIVPLQKTF